MKKKYDSESDIQRQICEWLNSCTFFFWRSNNIPVFGRALPKYAPKGLPDICILWEGLFIGVEVKRPASEMREPNGRRVRVGELSDFQATFGAKITMNDGEYHVVHSLEEAKAVMRSIAIRRGKQLPTATYGPIN
jgi:hypothetical protein